MQRAKDTRVPNSNAEIVNAFIKQSKEAAKMNAQSEAIRQRIPDTTGHYYQRDRRIRKKREPRIWRTLSRLLAIDLNKSQPDFVASLIFGEISYRFKNAPCYVYKEKKTWYFRSLRKMAEDFKFLPKSTIESAIDRLEAKGFLLVDRTKTKGDTLWFYVPEKLRLKYTNTKQLWFKVEHASKFGIRKALILGNLSWQAKYHWNCFEEDEEGKVYGTLRPSILSKKRLKSGTHEEAEIPYLPMSRNTLAAAIEKLCNDHKMLIPHPSRPGYYRFTEASDWAFSAEKSVNSDAEESDTDAKPSDSSAQSPDRDAQLSGTTVFLLRHNMLTLPHLSTIAKVAYNKACNKNSLKSTSKEESVTATAQATPKQRSEPPRELSPGTKALSNIIDQNKSRHDKVESASSALLPHECITKITELPYDELPPKRKGWNLSRMQQVKEIVALIKTEWRVFGVPFTLQDLDRLTIFFNDNPHFSHEDWQEIELALLQITRFVDRKGKYDSVYFLRKVSTAKHRLDYLRQIVFQMHVDRYYDDGEWIEDGTVPEPFLSLDYSYLGEASESRLLPTAPEVHEEVEHESNPMAA